MKTRLHPHAHFGPWIRQQRIDQHVTLPELATRSGISKGGVSRIEHGSDVQLSTVIKLCRALNCEIQIHPPIRSPLPL